MWKWNITTVIAETDIGVVYADWKRPVTAKKCYADFLIDRRHIYVACRSQSVWVSSTLDETERTTTRARDGCLARLTYSYCWSTMSGCAACSPAARLLQVVTWTDNHNFELIVLWRLAVRRQSFPSRVVNGVTVHPCPGLPSCQFSTGYALPF